MLVLSKGVDVEGASTPLVLSRAGLADSADYLISALEYIVRAEDSEFIIVGSLFLPPLLRL